MTGGQFFTGRHFSVTLRWNCDRSYAGNLTCFMSVISDHRWSGLPGTSSHR